MAIATHGNFHPGPVAPDAADDGLEDTRRLVPGRPLAGTQEREHRLGRGRLEDVDGLEAIVIIMGVEQRQLLAAVDRVLGIIDVEDDTAGNMVRAFAEQIDHG